jgi:hypothetical protein
MTAVYRRGYWICVAIVGAPPQVFSRWIRVIHGGMVVDGLVLVLCQGAFHHVEIAGRRAQDFRGFGEGFKDRLARGEFDLPEEAP